MGTLVEDIKNKTHVNLIFNHGIGDCVTFLPTLKRLSELFPSKTFHVVTIADQYKLFHRYGINASAHNSTRRLSDDAHTLTRTINYALTPSGAGMTKNDYCCHREIGIDPPDEIYHVGPPVETGIVGVHFQGTCMPHLTNVSEGMCRAVWDTVRRCGFVALEVHLLHAFSNPMNKKYPFVDFSTRGIPCDVDKLFSLLRSCHKFIGVLSGPAHCASMLLGMNNVLWLEKDIKIRDHVKTEHGCVKETTFDETQIAAFLRTSGSPSRGRVAEVSGRNAGLQPSVTRPLSWSP